MVVSLLIQATAMGLQSLAGGAHFLGSGALYLSVGGMLLYVLETKSNCLLCCLFHFCNFVEFLAV